MTAIKQAEAKNEVKPAPFSPCDAAGNPICEECDESMHQFGCVASKPPVSGWACSGCGWSFYT